MKKTISCRFYWKLIVFILVALLVGCSSPTSESTETSGKELVVDLHGDPASLDPGLQYDGASYSVYRNIFDNLLRRDSETLEIVPWVAKSWEETGPNTWEFIINEGIEFHDGTPLEASDVVFSIERILDPSLSSPQYSNFSMIDKVEADGNVVTITTKEPSPTLLTQLVNLSIVPEDYVTEHGKEYFNNNPVGSGAYVFESWVKGSEIVLKVNANYWNGEPTIKKVTFRAVPNDATRIADLQSGQADIAFQISTDDISAIEDNKDLQVLSTPTERVTYLAFNTIGNTPTQKKKVRKAIASGINYDKLISTLLDGYGDRVNAVLTPLSFGYNEDIESIDYDPERAKELLSEAGYPDGLTVDFATSPAYDERIVQAIQGSLDKIGITVNIVKTDHATYLQKVQNGKHDWGSIRMGNWSCACLDADGTIYPLFSTDSSWSSYSSDEFDMAVNAARETTDKDERLSLYKTALEILAEDVPGIGLWQSYTIYAASDNLKWDPDPQESFFVQDMEWVDEEG